MFSTVTERIRGLASLFWREVAKFGAVGGVAFVIDNGLFWYLIHGPMSDSEVKARFVSASVATVFAWIANRYWTFRHRRQPNPLRELGMFVFINLIGMGIAAGCVWIAKYPMDITDRPTLFFAGIVGTVLATVLRFVAYRFWVFNAELDEDPAFSQDRELFGHPDPGTGDTPVTASTGAPAGPGLVDSLGSAPTEPTLPRDQ
ncbi:GtrA family protein [Arthrobacter sp. CAN_A1]|uniref:GtrA family protein n=1 Tax=Arthrobacter sp. CAN_A1 TaxID=2787717 RepID=UPI0018C982D5